MHTIITFLCWIKRSVSVHVMYNKVTQVNEILWCMYLILTPKTVGEHYQYIQLDSNIQNKIKVIRPVWLLLCAPGMRWDDISECTGCLVQNPQPLGLHLHPWVGYGHIRTQSTCVGRSLNHTVFLQDTFNTTSPITGLFPPPVFDNLMLHFLHTVNGYKWLEAEKAWNMDRVEHWRLPKCTDFQNGSACRYSYKGTGPL